MRMGVKWCLESVKVEMGSDGGILFVVEFFNFVIDGIGWIEMKWKDDAEWCLCVWMELLEWVGCIDGVGVVHVCAWVCEWVKLFLCEMVVIGCVECEWVHFEVSLGVLGCPYHQNNSLPEWGRWSLSRFFSRSRGATEDLNIPLDRGLSALHLMRSPLEPVIHTFL